jgi:hypothetical protein
MSGYTSFVSMTRSEAKAYLDRFLDEMGPSLDRFAASVDRELTYTQESLERVWNAAAPKLAWRLGYTPPALGQPGPRIASEQLEAPQDLPSWFHHPSGAGYARFSAETLWVIDGAARYLGETFIRNVGGRWASGDARTEGYVYQNQPVLTDITTDPLSPMQTCAVLVARALRPSPEQGPHGLADVYDVWCTLAAKQ